MANNWIELNGKKEPPFGTRMMILLTGTNHWVPVFLKRKEETEQGKVYIFHSISDSEVEYSTVSHYMIPEPTKEKG